MTKLPLFIRTWIWGPIALTLAFAPLLLSQILQMLTILVLPFSRVAFRRLNTLIAASVWGYWGWAIQYINGTKIEIRGDQLPWREDAIVFSNHQEMSDIVVIICLALASGSVGHMKWLVKDIIKYVPGVGWGMLFLDCVFLKRDWARDANTIRRIFSRIADNHLPVWLVSFPEGTRVTPAKLKQGQERDKERGVVPYKYLLPPKPKGFTASIAGLRKHVKAVYSVTIAYPGGVPTLFGLMRGDQDRVIVHVRRFPVDSLPVDDAGLARWLEQEFRVKDQLMNELA